MNATNEFDLEQAEAEMNQAAVHVAEALMRNLDVTELLKVFKAAREKFLFGGDE